MKTKIVLTVLLFIAVAVANTVYNAAQGPIESSIAVAQLEDSVTSYTVAQKISEGKLPYVWNFGAVCLLGIMWVPTIIRKMKD